MITDFFGTTIELGDYVACGYDRDHAELEVFQVIGATPKGYLKVKGQYSWRRSQIQDPSRDCIKITKAQFDLKSKDWVKK